ncbi:hypothetical protein ACHAWO_001918 [Cyclotella atomus]|uniref:Essential protein Yae1 N-terminal domain-containing protein n=1 Tax=Cyclotella atomus TaxID=382360 RepID=A0ABD3P213_9STRA
MAQHNITPSIDTFSTAVDWDNSLFDDVIDPFQQIAISERAQGQEAGRRAGYLDGRDIGRTKGWEIGLELGYIHAFANNFIDGCRKREQNTKEQTDTNQEERSTSADRGNHRLDRCLTVSRELIDLVNCFPDPDELLAQRTDIAEIDAIELSGRDDSKIAPDTSRVDVTSSLQRIRAKFKLLLVLLRTRTPLDLKRLLNRNHSVEDEKHATDTKGKESTVLPKESDW